MKDESRREEGGMREAGCEDGCEDGYEEGM